MANDRKKYKEEFVKPTFDKQMETYSAEEANADDPIFSSAYHKFMSNLLKTRDKALTGELVREFRAEVTEHYAPIMKLLEKMEIGQDKIVTDLSGMKIDMGHMKCDIIGIRQQVQSVRDNYERLEIRQLKIQEDVEQLKYNTNDRRMWTLRVVLVFLTVLLALGLFVLLFPAIHKYRMLSFLSWV